MIKNRLILFYQKWTRVTSNHPWLFPIFLLGLALLTYGVFLFSLGFYWDDWSPILLRHIGGAKSVWDFYLSDRPFQSWTYIVLFPICRDSTVAWQLSAILFRWTTTLTLFYTFLRLFPKQKTLLQWTAVLFLVFPGFGDLYASVSFGSHFMAYTVFGLSMLTMVLAYQNKKRFWIFMPLSLVLSAIHMLTMEYFVLLEALRPILLFILFNQAEKKPWKNIGKALLNWLPWLAVLCGYLYWRMLVYPTWIGGQHESNTPYLLQNFLAAPSETLIAFIKSSFQDLKFLFLGTWSDRLLPADLPIDRSIFWFSIFLGCAASVAFYFLFLFHKDNTDGVPSRREGWTNIFIGIAITLLGMFPAWSTLRQITKGKWSDRFDIAAIFGVVLILSTLIFVAIQNRKFRDTLFILLVGLSIAFHIRMANDYRQDFKRQISYFSQLSWRVPALPPGTAVYAPGIPTDKASDYSYTMGINLLYETGKMDKTLNYWFIGPRDYPAQELIDNPSTPIKKTARDLTFESSAQQIISVYLPVSGCLWVVDPYYAMANPDSNFQFYAQFSNQSMILSEGHPQDSRMANILDIDPSNDQSSWCYFFEKADLAQSKGDFEQAVNLYQQAESLGLIPLEGVERLPFIKSYAKTGDIQKAVELSQQMLAKTPSTQKMLCRLWADLQQQDPTLSLDAINPVYNEEVCIQGSY